MGERILYRKLAMKSRIGFGKWATCTVQDLFKIKQEQYLAYLYYNCSNISFLDEIAERLELIPIQKPGKDEELFIKWKKMWNQEQSKLYTQEQKEHGIYKIRRINRVKKNIRLAKAINAESYSRAELQAINHGHIKSKEL